MTSDREENTKKSINEIIEDLNNLLNKMPQILSGIKFPDVKPVDFNEIVNKLEDEKQDLKEKENNSPAKENLETKDFEETNFSADNKDKNEKNNENILPEVILEQNENEIELKEENNKPTEEENQDKDLLSVASMDGNNQESEKNNFKSNIESQSLEVFEKYEIDGGKDNSNIVTDENKNEFFETAEIRIETPEIKSEEILNTTEVKNEEIEKNAFESTAEFEAPDLDFLLNLAQMSQQKNGGEMNKEDENKEIKEGKIDKATDETKAEIEQKEEKTIVFNSEEQTVKEGDKEVELSIDLNEEEKKIEEQLPNKFNSQNQENNAYENELNKLVSQAENLLDENKSQFEENSQNLNFQDVLKTEEKTIFEDVSLQTSEQKINENISTEKQEGVDSIQPTTEIQNEEISLKSAEVSSDMTLDKSLDAPKEEKNLTGEISIGDIYIDITEKEKKDFTEIEAEKTLFVQSENMEEKTILFEQSPSVLPSETSSKVIQNEDLIKIFDRQIPENVSQDRIKNVGFMYSSDKNILLNILNIMDEICLSSQEKPMFVKRSFVLEFSPDINSNYIVQKINETQSIAFIAAGNFPQDKIYEIATALNSAEIIFKHINSENLNRSEIINFILELIIK